MKASAGTRIFFFDNRIEEQDTTTSQTSSFFLRLIHFFLCLLFISCTAGRKSNAYGKCKMILDISAIEQATCDNIQRLFEFIHTLFSFHLFPFFLFFFSPHTYVLSLIVLHKQTIHCIYCMLFTIYGWIDLIIYPLALFL
jgi:hypothetical protein